MLARLNSNILGRVLQCFEGFISTCENYYDSPKRVTTETDKRKLTHTSMLGY